MLILKKKSLTESPDCLTIDRKVPLGISYLGDGTVTVCPSFEYF